MTWFEYVAVGLILIAGFAALLMATILLSRAWKLRRPKDERFTRDDLEKYEDREGETKL